VRQCHDCVQFLFRRGHIRKLPSRPNKLLRKKGKEKVKVGWLLLASVSLSFFTHYVATNQAFVSSWIFNGLLLHLLRIRCWRHNGLLSCLETRELPNVIQCRRLAGRIGSVAGGKSSSYIQVGDRWVVFCIPAKGLGGCELSKWALCGLKDFSATLVLKKTK